MDGSLNYKAFSVKAALELISPPTWVASIGPCLVGGGFAVGTALLFQLAAGGVDVGVLTAVAAPLTPRSLLCWILMLCCAVLMQSATNTLNDYHDFMSGLDTEDTILDETDASIVYNQIDPRAAKRFALVLLLIAAVCGLVVVLLSSWTLLILGLIGALAVVLYSAGPKPISSLPLGELVSGLVMGGIITCATYYAMTLRFSSAVLAVALITAVSIGQINQTNNTCDITRDLAVGRKTFPGILGEKRSRLLNGGLSLFCYLWLVLLLVWTGFYGGLIVVLVSFVVSLPKINRLLKGPYTLENRREMMQTVVSYTSWLHTSTALAFIVGGVIRVII